MHAIEEVANHCERYRKNYWIAAKRELKYLKTTADLSIVFYGKDQGELLGYADASGANDLDSRRSTTGYVFFLHDNRQWQLLSPRLSTWHCTLQHKRRCGYVYYCPTLASNFERRPSMKTIKVASRWQKIRSSMHEQRTST